MQKTKLLNLALMICAPLFLTAGVIFPSDSLPKQQEMQVVFVKGKVSLQSTGKLLRKNDFFGAGESLKFEAQANRMVIMNHKRSLFIAFPDAKKKAGYLLEPLQMAANTRPGKIMNYLSFQKYLDGRRILALGDTLSIEIGGNELEMNENKFFYIQYKWEQETEPINKRLAFSGQNLIIDKRTLFTVDEQPITPAAVSDFKLYYYDSLANTSTLINTIDIVFADLEELYKEVDAIVELLGTFSKKSDVKDAVLQYIHTQYGEPKKDEVEQWLNLHWKL